MPYVDEKVRDHLDPSIDILVSTMYHDGPTYTFEPGNVNYAITRLLIGWWKRNPKYVTICLVVGTLFCVALEFYRRIAAHYEHGKIHTNGDVY